MRRTSDFLKGQESSTSSQRSNRRAVGAQLYTMASITGVQLLQVPIFLHFVDVEVYGTYLALIALPSLLTLSDVGLLSASSTRLLQLVETDRLPLATRVLRTSSTAILLLALVVLIALNAISAVFLQESSLVTSADSRMIVLFYSLYSFSYLLGNIFEAVMRSCGNYANAWIRLASMRMIDFLCSALLLAASSSLVLAALGLFASRAIGVIFLGAASKKSAPWMDLRPLLDFRSAMAGLLKPTIGSASLPVGNWFLNQGIVLAVGSILGPTALVGYTTARTMMNTLRQITNALTNAALPSLTKLYAQGRSKEASKIVKRTIAATMISTAICGVVLVLSGPWLMSVWTDNRITVSQDFLILLLVVSLIDSCWLVMSMRLLSKNRHFVYGLSFLVFSSLVPLMIFIVKSQSIESVVLLLICQSSVMLSIIILLLSKDK